MMREIKHAMQIKGEPFRRWFSDETFDLIVWYASKDDITGFQLCYSDGPEEKALTWLHDHGFSHKRIDDGESRPVRHKMTPILVPDGAFNRDYILDLFEKASRRIDSAVAHFVIQKTKKYPKPERCN